MLVDVSPFLHRQSRRRLLSKFHGPLFSTHSIWYLELNLNWRMLFPTSTILKSEPIFHAIHNVLLRARGFCCRSDSSHPNRLSEHSSNSSCLPMVDIVISSSSSFVSCRLCRLSMIPCSILWLCMDTPQ